MVMPAEISWIVLLFPVVFAVHNAEEYVRLDAFLLVYCSRLPVSLRKPSVVLSANVMLVAAAMLLSALTCLLASQRLVYWVNVSIYALLLNAVGHGIVSMKRGEMTPGTWSAVLMVVPYSVASLLRIQSYLRPTLRTLTELSLMGAVAGPAAIFLMLGLSYFLIRLGGAWQARYVLCVAGEGGDIGEMSVRCRCRRVYWSGLKLGARGAETMHMERWWAVRDSNPRHPACKAGALTN